MKFLRSIFLLITLSFISAVFPVHAGSYSISKLTHVYTDVSGKIAIKWQGAPDPGPCGTNNGWVVIEAGSDRAIQSFVYALYMSEKPATIVTTGCAGTNEKVTGVYSPGG